MSDVHIVEHQLVDQGVTILTRYNQITCLPHMNYTF